MQRYVFFLKERTFLHHFYIIIGGGKNDVKFDVKIWWFEQFEIILQPESLINLIGI